MSLRLTGLRKAYADTVAVDGVTLELREAETLALLGPSGCGKSTLLRLVAGLEAPDEGTVKLDDRDLTPLPPRRRGVGMVFQDYALFPHLDVGDNVAFGLVELGWDRKRRQARVEELLELVGLDGLGHRRIDALSGGQQQRVALARALAPQPRVLLLDEPLSNLDQTLRDDLKRELTRLLRELDVRSVYVTHDQAEAFTVGERVAVMRRGRIVQVGAARDVLDRPATAWVAGFLGYRNVLSRAELEAIPGAPDTGSAVLRGDLIELSPAAQDGPGLAGDVRDVRRAGQGWHVDIALREANLTVTFDGFARDLPDDLERGTPVRLVVPQRAWVPLVEDDA